MSVKSFLPIFFGFLVLVTSTRLYAAPPQAYSSPRSPGEDLSSAIRTLKADVSLLKNNVNNQETEIRTFGNRLDNQELSFEHIRVQLTEDFRSQRDLIRAFQLNAENRLASLEQASKESEGLIKSTATDLRQLSSQANDTINVLAAYKTGIAELEQTVRNQAQHLAHIEAALQSITELIQLKDPLKPGADSSEKEQKYRVKSGDFLEKIARLHKVSVKSLREANPQITDDRIFEGQLLTIP